MEFQEMGGHISLDDLNIKLGYSETFGQDYFYTEEEKAYKNEWKEFLAREIAPLTKEFERNPNYKDAQEITGHVPMKYLYRWLPQNVGGEGRGVIYECIFFEEFCAVDFVVGHQIRNRISAGAIKFFNEKQIKEHVLSCLSGEKIGSWAVTEPWGGSDPLRTMHTTAKKSGNDYVLRGEKRFITFGGTADIMVVAAVTREDVHRRDGITIFVLPTKTRGFEVVENHAMMGRRGNNVAWVRFNDCRIPRENIVGEENKGAQLLASIMNRERLAWMAELLGPARTAFEIAVKYAHKREAFGKPLRQYEGISFKLADMYTKLDISRQLIIRAARMIDAGLDPTKEVSVCKVFTSVSADEIAYDALQVLGGIGYTNHFPVERIARELRTGTLADGATEVQKFIIQREIYRDAGL